jgi:hypothetical protein
VTSWPALLGGAALFGAAALLSSAGCDSSSTTSPAAGACPQPVALSDTGASISFRNDVAPVFAYSCAFSSCHDPSRTDRVVLGVRPDAGASVAPSDIRHALLGPSNASDMNLVEPSKPESSFLMFKLDGNLCAIESRCRSGCGDPMPKDNDPLDAAKRDTIRRWIAQGALDN